MKEGSDNPLSPAVSGRTSPVETPSKVGHEGKNNKVRNIDDNELVSKTRAKILATKQSQVGHVKRLLRKFMDGKFILILMTMVTIFAIIGVSFVCLQLLIGRPACVADNKEG